MKQKILIAAFALLGCLITGCKEKSKIGSSNSGKTETELITTMDNSQTSLDWPGTYKGVLPCADCEGIETEITLTKNNTYIVKTMYLGKEDKASEKTGTFSWNASGSTVILAGLANGANQYLVGENKLIQLDRTGNKITGNLADKYILIKQ